MANRPYVNKVESIIKGTVVCQPGRRTLIVGKNGIGKSRIVNSVEAAGTGKVSDVAGRALLARDADLFMLAPPEAERVWSVVKLSDGGEASWSIDKGHKAKRTGPEIAFPLRDAREAILGSPETARKWILRHGGEMDWNKDVVSLIPESLRKMLNSEWEVTAAEHGTASAIAGALEAARQRVRELNATVKAQRTVTAPPQPPPTDAELQALESIISTWKSQEGRARLGSQVDSLRAQLAEAKLQAETHSNRLQGIEGELAAIPPVPSQALREAAVLVCEAMARASMKECALCGGKTDPADIQRRADLGRSKINEALQATKRRSDLEFAQREAVSDLAFVRREVVRLTELVDEATKLAGVGVVALPEIDEETATVRLASLRAIQAGWNSARRAEELALQAERDAQEWDQLADALAKALGVLVEKARVGFESRVQKFLPNSDLFGVDLLDGDREVLRIGLRRLHGDRMVLHPALSGAEWARVTAALALATAPAEGPCVIVPEERAFDPETLADVLAAFDQGLLAAGENSPQVIVTSPVPPARVPADWVTISLEGDSVTESVKEKGAAKMEKKGGDPAAPAEPAAPPAKKRRGGSIRKEDGEAATKTLVEKDGELVPVEKNGAQTISDPMDLFR